MRVFKSVLSLAICLMMAQTVANQAFADDSNTFNSDELAQALKTIGDDGSDFAQAIASGVAKIVGDLGAPTAVIYGREAQGAFFVGYRKGDGKILFKGQDPASAQKIYWEAPSFGLQAGVAASRVAVLVYGATNYDQLMQSYASVQGSYYVIGGAGVSYLNNLANHAENTVQLAYVAVGVGGEIGVRLEGLTLSKDSSWLPF